MVSHPESIAAILDLCKLQELYKAWHSLDCCRLNGRDIIAYMLLRFTVLFVLLIINETVYVVV